MVNFIVVPNRVSKGIHVCIGRVSSNLVKVVNTTKDSCHVIDSNGDGLYKVEGISIIIRDQLVRDYIVQITKVVDYLLLKGITIEGNRRADKIERAFLLNPLVIIRGFGEVQIKSYYISANGHRLDLVELMPLRFSGVVFL